MGIWDTRSRAGRQTPEPDTEIEVRNVTMEFRRAKDEATSIKELMVRILRRQHNGSTGVHINNLYVFPLAAVHPGLLRGKAIPASRKKAECRRHRQYQRRRYPGIRGRPFPARPAAGTRWPDARIR